MRTLTNLHIRNSKIPCKECGKGTLYWNPEESVYVCIECGIQEKALKTWIGAAEHRKMKKEKKREKERKWALDILGIKDKLNSQKKTKKEREWSDIIEKIEQKDNNS